jgi:hypothetical protein
MAKRQFSDKPPPGGFVVLRRCFAPLFCVHVPAAAGISILIVKRFTLGAGQQWFNARDRKII